MWQYLAPIAGDLLTKSYFNNVNNAAVSNLNDRQIGYDREKTDRMVSLANNAHVREVDDLIRAGLNPTLSAGGAGSPVSGTGGAPSMHAPIPFQMPDVYQAVSMAQEQQKIAIQDKLATAAVAKSGSEKEMIDVKKNLEGRGILKSLDNEGGEFVREVFRYMKNNSKKPVNKIKNMLPVDNTGMPSGGLP